MAVEFTVELENQPGTLADLAETLSKSGINIMAIHAGPGMVCGSLQFITNNADATVNVLSNFNTAYTSKEVLLIALPDVPGSLALVARAMAQAGINIDALYITMSGQIVLDVDQFHKAQKVILELDIVH